MAKDNRITLYDLVLETGCTISPFVWATKYALKHKGFDLDLIPNGFTGIEELTGGRSNRLPVIVDGGHWVKDSWGIVEYLEQTYPDRPRLVEGEGHKQAIKFLDAWMWRTIIHAWFRCYILDYHDLSMEKDRAYVRESRETMFLGGEKLENVQAGREQRLPGASKLLDPLRALLVDKPWLGGDSPDYGDYRALSCFLWLGSVAKIPALYEDDPLRDWVERGFDLYDGLGRHPGMHPIFGLPKDVEQPVAA